MINGFAGSKQLEWVYNVELGFGWIVMNIVWASFGDRLGTVAGWVNPLGLARTEAVRAGFGGPCPLGPTWLSSEKGARSLFFPLCCSFSLLFSSS